MTEAQAHAADWRAVAHLMEQRLANPSPAILPTILAQWQALRRHALDLADALSGHPA